MEQPVIYKTISIFADTTVKVSPLKLDNENNLTLISEVMAALEETESVTIFIRRAPQIVNALRENLAEQHSVEEIDKAISQLRISSSIDSPYMQCAQILFGLNSE